MARAAWALLGALIWMGIGGLAAYLYAPIKVTIIATSCGGFLGGLLGVAMARSSGKLSAFYAGALAIWIGVLSLAWFGLNFELLAKMLGPAQAYSAVTTLKFSVLALIGAALLRASSIRKPSFVAAEACILAALIAKLFSGHRLGNINRPFFLVDPLWSKGYDPQPAFMAIGAIAAVMVIVLALSGRPKKHTFRDLCLVLVMFVGLYMIIPISALEDLPKPPGFTEQGDTAQREAKFSEDDTPNFDDRKRKRGNAPMAVVLFEQDYEPPDGTYYFRQRPYSAIDGDKLLGDKSGQFNRDVPDQFPSDSTELTHEPTDIREGAVIDTTICLLSEHSRPVALEQPLEIAPAINPNPARFRKAYKVKSWGRAQLSFEQLLASEVGSPDWSESERAHYLRTPRNRRYKELSDEIVERMAEQYRENPTARAIMIRSWLGEKGTYCLHTKHSKAEDPVASFLFGDRTGYCVYFAHAACFLFRSAGVPSRVMGGYAVPAENRAKGKALIIGGRYAHAWPEIYLQDMGWIPFDIYPETTLEEPIEPPDQNLQQLLGELALSIDTDSELPDLDKKQDLQKMARQSVVWILTYLPFLFLLLYSVLQFLRLRQSWLALHGPLEKRYLTTYKGVLQRLAEFGLVRGKGETRTEFAQRVSPQCPSLAKLTHIHLEHSLGHKSLQPTAEQFTELYKNANQALKAERSPGRRLLAWLDPWNWTRAR